MRRKGAVGEQVTKAALAVLVLAAVGYLGYLIFTGQIYSFLRLTPSNLTDIGQPSGLEVIGYKIGDGNMYYYTGSNWVMNNKIGAFNEKAINMADAGKRLKDFYFLASSRTAGKQTTVNGKTATIAILYQFSAQETSGRSVGFWESIYTYTPAGTVNLVSGLKQELGDILVDVKDEKGTLAYDLIIKLDGSVYKAAFNSDGSRNDFAKVNSISDDDSKIRDFAVSWRESVFSKPIELIYMRNVQGGTISVPTKYCVTKVSPDYLAVYLDRPATSEVCGQ